MASSSSSSSMASPETLQGLHWGLKRSFIDYVRRMPDGQTGASSGAVGIDAYEVAYPILQGGRRSAAEDIEERFWEFGGNLRFKGHSGMLFVRIASPSVFIRDGVGQLSIDDPFAREGGKRRVLAHLVLERRSESDGMEVWNSTEVRLHPDGVEVFGEVYPAGEPLEPLRIVSPAFG